MGSGKLISKFLVWRIKHISNKNFVLILAALIGCFSGLAAISLKWVAHFVNDKLTGNFHQGISNYYFLAFPLIGLVITAILSNYLFKVVLGHGVSNILYSISKGSSLMKKRKMISSWFTAMFTVGFGGSAGLESPILTTGAAIGANVGKTAHMNYRKRTLLIGCGAAGAISAIFNAPIAGVIFAIEIILAETAINTLIPLLIASTAGKMIRMLLDNNDVMFHVSGKVEPFFSSQLPYFIGLGIFCGFVALYFTMIQYFVENWVSKIKNGVARAAFAGIVLGIIILIFPPIYGEGYNIIEFLVNGDKAANGLLEYSFFHDKDHIYFIIGFVALLLLFKGLATAITIESGGSGGIFAPSLFIGGIGGYLFAISFNEMLGTNLPVANFVLVGMCGVMSGIQHAPLAAIFLIAELTKGYELFIPLMIVSSISYLTKSYFEPHSIYTKKLILKGQLINNKDKQVLSLIDVKKLVETDFHIVNIEASLGELIDIIKESTRNVFPVVDDKNQLVGILRLDDVRRIMFDQGMYEKIQVKTLMHQPRAIVKCDENMNDVMSKFEATNTWNLAVVTNEGEYIGMISKSKVFSSYRNRLKRQQKE